MNNSYGCNSNVNGSFSSSIVSGILLDLDYENATGTYSYIYPYDYSIHLEGKLIWLEKESDEEVSLTYFDCRNGTYDSLILEFTPW
jgi:hypothetical protein